MRYKVFISDGGVPKTGLSPVWSSLRTAAGVDVLASAPAIVEIGGGWYTFSVVHGVAPFTVSELVGVIDAGASLANADRYVPVVVSVRDLALAKLVNKATYDLVSGVETIRNDDDTADELRITLSQSGDVESRVIG